MLINTVTGKKELSHGKILAHEHIVCFSQAYYLMAKEKYLDKCTIKNKAALYLSELKEKHGLCAVVDCTPVNIGRDIELIKEVCVLSGVDIICSTGFYYTDEIMFARHSDEYMAEQILCDIEKNRPGIIKFAVQAQKMTDLNKKMLNVLCEIQKKTALPLCIHTNSGERNGTEVLDFVLSRNIKPSAVTIGHLSDSDDMGYVKDILSSGVFGGFDRIYSGGDSAYYNSKACDIAELVKHGYEKKLLLSHDGLVFNGFNDKAQIASCNPYAAVFEKLAPSLEKLGLPTETVNMIFEDNPQKMLEA